MTLVKIDKTSLKTTKALLQNRGANLGLLNARQLENYYLNRRRNLLLERQILFKKELEYLLCETGNGALRFDPEIVNVLEQESVRVADKRTWVYNDIVRLERIKQDIDNVLETESLNFNVLAPRFEDWLSIHIGEISQVDSRILAYKGLVNEKKVRIYVLPKGWLMPNDKLVELLWEARRDEAVPIFIAQKIHGLLFPLFKLIGAVGYNTYTSILSDQGMKKIIKGNETLLELSSPRFNKLKYHGRYTSIDEYLQFSSEALEAFMARLPDITNGSSFVDSSIDLSDDFQVFIESLKRSKIKSALLKWSTDRKNILDKLIKLK